jgi:hypothetical protein
MLRHNSLRTAVGFAAMTAVIVMSSCWILSFQPLYFEDDLLFDVDLLGVWENQDEDGDVERWTFLRGKNDSYRLLLTDNKGFEGEFEARLLRLDNLLYLDLLPSEPDEGNEFYYAHTVPFHSFLRIEKPGIELKLRAMDYDWLDTRLKDGRISIGHARRKDGFILTAPTEKLQEFITEYTDEVFSPESGILKRVNE